MNSLSSPLNEQADEDVDVDKEDAEEAVVVVVEDVG